MVRADVVRVLHAVGAMNRAGAETWLMHVLRGADPARVRMDFLVHGAARGAYDDEIEATGSRLVRVPDPRHPLAWLRGTGRALREHGPYAVVHAHLQHFNGAVLRVARRSGVPRRVAHSHNDTRPAESGTGPLRRGYLGLMRWLVRRDATHGIAVSGAAAVDLFGTDWRTDSRFRVVPCGIDLAPFRCPVDAAAIRRQLGLDPQAVVLTHVGRFHEQKNHALLLDMAEILARDTPGLRLLLVGDGPLRAAIEHRAAAPGLAGRVIFAGSRADVPQILLAASDLFVLPSRYEGLGLALVEAQAAGLPCVVSDRVPPEAQAIGRLLRRVGVNEPPERWAAAAREALAARSAARARPAWHEIEGGPLDATSSTRAMMELYLEPR